MRVQDASSAAPKLRRTGIGQQSAGLALLVVGVLILINLVSVRYAVSGSSMQPGFDEAQLLYVSRLHYLLGDPQRYDVVVFHHPRNGDDDYIKRIIGLPGERIEIRNTQVLVDGQALDEPYIREACTALRCRDDRWDLGPQEYFVLGDNRNQSTDSRAFGPVARHDLVGKVVFRYWPPATWGMIDRAGP